MTARPVTDIADSTFDRLVDDLIARLQTGDAVDWSAIERDHPAHVARLQSLAPALAALGELSRSGEPAADGFESTDGHTTGVLGDFRIIQEVGRGGMGVVYEAEQVSLERRVALKVLPFAATMDPRHLQRFKNEAKAAASLKHEHIVQVYGVGCERSIHFYAMEFVEGQTLAQVISGRAGSRERPEDDRSPATAPFVENEKLGALTQPRSPDTVPVAALTTERSGSRGREFYRNAARLIADAADALEHAHSFGIVHRDVKPGNLLLDNTGKVYVSDFGLARIGTDAGLTMSGDLLGTLRYMAPEQAMARHGLADHRVDVYGLGATLYELLTGQPALRGEDKAEILRQIAFEEPIAPRKLDKRIPLELETVALKALAKYPGDRYASAGELAADLRRWLEDKAIKARRPTMQQRLGRWARRHPGLTAALGVVVGLLLAGGWAWHRETTNAEKAAQAVADESDQLRDADRLPEALQAARRAADLLPRFGGDAALRREMAERAADLQLLIRLDEARLAMAAERADLSRGRDKFDEQSAIPLFRQALLDYGLDVLGGDESAVVEALRRRSVSAHVATTLFEWERITEESTAKERLGRMAVALDDDPRKFLSRIRRAEAAKDAEALRGLGGEARSDPPKPEVLIRLALALKSVSLLEDAEQLLRAGQFHYPSDFFVNCRIADAIQGQEPAGAAEAMNCCRIAIALRPTAPAGWMGLSGKLGNAGQHKKAEVLLRRAIALNPDSGLLHNALGVALARARHGKLDAASFQGGLESAEARACFQSAEAAFRRAITLKPDFVHAHMHLGIMLSKLERDAEAEAHYRRAIALDPKEDLPHRNLGQTLVNLGRHAEAEAAYRRAIELKPDNYEAHTCLAEALNRQKRHADAEAVLRRAIALNPNESEAHVDLGLTLLETGRQVEAEAAYRRAIELKHDDHSAHEGLGIMLNRLGRNGEAEAPLRQAIALHPNKSEYHLNLGIVLSKLGRHGEADAAYRRAIELKPEVARAHDLLGASLLQQARYAEAEAAHRRAIELKPDSHAGHLNLGNVFWKLGKFVEAEAAFRRATELKPDLAEAHFWHGFALTKLERHTEAATAYREAIKLKPDYALAHKHLGEAELMAALAPRLPSLLAGESEPANASEQVTLARICQRYKKRYATAARLFAAAFAAEPKLAEEHRYGAAMSAALAARGEGEDAATLDDTERVRLRRQALDWLTAELAAKAKLADNAADRPQVRKSMQHWQAATEFPDVRGDAVLAKLPEAERAAWQKFWADVAELLKRCEERQEAVKPPPER